MLANGKGRACLPEDHPLSGGGFMSLAAVRQSGGPDVVLMLGARLGLFTGGAQSSLIPASAHLIQVDIEGEEIGRNREVQTGVVADCAATLRALSECRERTHLAATARRGPDALRATRTGHGCVVRRSRVRRRRPSTRTASRATSQPSWIAPSDVLVGDGGETAFWLEMASTVRAPGQWLSHGYLGCLGTGPAIRDRGADCPPASARRSV